MKNFGRHLNSFWGIFYHCKSKTTIRLVSFDLFGGFLYGIIDHYNDAEVNTAMLPISVRYLCRNTKCQADFSRYLKRFIMDSRFLPISQISGKIFNSVVQISL
jgi:hypothetical protein